MVSRRSTPLGRYRPSASAIANWRYFVEVRTPQMIEQLTGHPEFAADLARIQEGDDLVRKMLKQYDATGTVSSALANRHKVLRAHAINQARKARR